MNVLSSLSIQLIFKLVLRTDLWNDSSDCYCFECIWKATIRYEVFTSFGHRLMKPHFLLYWFHSLRLFGSHIYDGIRLFLVDCISRTWCPFQWWMVFFFIIILRGVINLGSVHFFRFDIWSNQSYLVQPSPYYPQKSAKIVVY